MPDEIAAAEVADIGADERYLMMLVIGLVRTEFATLLGLLARMS
ncbi:hypothetical protein [Methylobacterium sp. WL64]|nr:hypothetical protein [Methylobacterium sp. WL64]